MAAKEKSACLNPAESMEILGSLHKDRRKVERQIELLKAQLSEAKSLLNSLNSKLYSTIEGENTKNLFNQPKEVDPVNPPSAAKPPKDWKKKPLAELLVTANDVDALAGAGVKTVGDWDKYTKNLSDVARATIGYGITELGNAGVKRVETAIREFLSGKTKVAAATPE